MDRPLGAATGDPHQANPRTHFRILAPPVAAGPVGDEAALHVALRLKALADPVRVKLMSLLLASPEDGRNGGELADTVGLSESTVSHHLGQLRKAGLVNSERHGMGVVHRVHRNALCVVLDSNCCK